MVSKELNVAQALCRVFNWHTLLLWAHQMPEQSVVMLSGKDSIVPSPEVRSYLDSHQVPVIYNENLKHAEFLVCPDLQKKFLERLYRFKGAGRGPGPRSCVRAEAQPLQEGDRLAARGRSGPGPRACLRVQAQPLEEEGREAVAPQRCWSTGPGPCTCLRV